MQQELAHEIALHLAGGSILSEQGKVEEIITDDFEKGGAPLLDGITAKEDIEQVMKEYQAIGVRLVLQAEKMHAIRKGWVEGINEHEGMSGERYLIEVLRTYAGGAKPIEKLTLSAFGLAGESGEVVDHIKKVVYAGHAIDFTHLAEELGDILWYLALACDAIGYSLQDIMQMNVAKLRKRYPDGFDPQRSINR